MSARMFRRREFLASSALTALIVGCAPQGSRLPLAAGSAADDVFGLQAAQSLVRMARLLYPHDAVSDEVYDRVVERVMVGGAIRDSSATYRDGVASLDGARGRAWLSLREREQIAVLEEIEETQFFGAMRAGVQAQLYEDPEVWAAIGYPGPALPFGGYWDKGFDDIDWLPAEDA